jgi:uncharacterized membrane protein
MIVDPIAVFLVLSASVYLSLRLEESFRLFKAMGAALVALLSGVVLSNSSLLPGESPTYDFLVGPGVRGGVVLILLSVNVKSLRQAGPKMLAAFGLGAAGTVIGSITAGLVLFPQVGAETWKLAGQFTGTYIGGGMNFAALGQALGTSSDLFSAAVAADVILTAFWMATCLSVPVLLGKQKQKASAKPVGNPTNNTKSLITLEHTLYSSVKPVHLRDAAALVAIVFGALWGSEQLAAFFPMLPSVLWLTTLVLLGAQVPSVRSLTGSAMVGNYLVLMFLAANGAQSVVANIVKVGPAVFYFATLTVTIHGVVIFGLGRLFKIDFGTLAVASQSNVGGAASGMAMASARGYTDRILPGVAVGLLGYAIGNYLGFAVAALMRGWLAG